MFLLKTKMYYSSVLLSAVVFCLSEVASIKQCGTDCIVFTNCFAALEMANYRRDSASKNIFREAYCGMEIRETETIPKVCCSDFSPLEDEIETHLNRQLLPNVCGDYQINRIYHGVEVKLYEMKWMALISYGTKGNYMFNCGGSLINSRYVLTAAHCVVGETIAGVRVGELDLATQIDCQGSPPTCETYRDYLVESKIVHEEYTESQLLNDIALLRLKRQIKLPKHVAPICLPVSKQLREFLVYNRTATVAGWGQTETNPTPSKLQKARIRIRSQEECALYNGRVMTENTLCAGGSKEDSCKGDSGGPLMISVSINGSTKYVQYGIVSHGPVPCGSAPATYTAVSKYVKWILDNIHP